ncbi:MAG: tetratricopeptide repeat protein [Chloroflexi bacterium]|nr:tetratricopeptide repeat protein [Chloroflexota bacterium]
MKHRLKMEMHKEAWEHIKNAEKLEGDFAYPEALKELRESENLDPSFTRVYSLRGDILRQMGRGSDSIVAFKKALELEPNNPDILHDLGFSYQWKGETESAIECYKKALKINPNHIASHKNLADAYMILMATQPRGSKEWNDLWDNAYREAEIAIKLNPDEWGAYYIMGQLHFVKKEDDDAIKAFSTVTKEPENDRYEYIMRSYATQGFIHYYQGKRDLALKEFDKYIQMWHDRPGYNVDCILPDREKYSFYREVLLGKKFTKEMLEQYESTDQKFLSRGVVMPVITLELRKFFKDYIDARDRHDTKAMEKTLRDQLMKNPARYANCSGIILMGIPELDAETAYLLAGILADSGRHDEAMKIYKKGLDLCPGHPLLEQGLAKLPEKRQSP